MRKTLLAAALVAMTLAGCGAEQELADETSEQANQELAPGLGYYSVGIGTYKGKGTWTDTTGKSGTLTDVTKIELLPSGNLQNTETATYSDGHVETMVITYAQQGGSRYNVTVQVNGQPVVIGNGACGPNQCLTSVTLPTGQYFENTNYVRGLVKRMSREGGFSNVSTGVWRFYRLEEVVH